MHASFWCLSLTVKGLLSLFCPLNFRAIVPILLLMNYVKVHLTPIFFFAEYFCAILFLIWLNPWFSMPGWSPAPFGSRPRFRRSGGSEGVTSITEQRSVSSLQFPFYSKDFLGLYAAKCLWLGPQNQLYSTKIDNVFLFIWFADEFWLGILRDLFYRSRTEHSDLSRTGCVYVFQSIPAFGAESESSKILVCVKTPSLNTGFIV